MESPSNKIGRKNVKKGTTIFEETYKPKLVTSEKYWKT